ncbi:MULTISPECIES: hypothetical protein [unclassified Micromonospora]|uniref:hypothetical protein n=1 Tax=unclassified Micromonospora TaxID=2617518 RepID=UPI00331951CE
MPSTTLRTARADRPCAFARHYEDHTINAGDLYVRSVAFPGDEGHEDGTRPWAMHVCVKCADAQVEWVRHQYQVPATIGCRVTADGKRGRIAGGDGSSLLIVIDGKRRATPWHPTWRMQYHPEEANA